MGCWYHAHKIQVSDYEQDPDDDDGEGVTVEYMVSDHEEGDKILLDTHGNDQVDPELALRVADAITKVHAWSLSKPGQEEIARLRARHYEPRKVVSK